MFTLPVLTKAFAILAVLTALAFAASTASAATTSSSVSARATSASTQIGQTTGQRSSRCRKATRRWRAANRARSARGQRAVRRPICARRSRRRPRTTAPEPTPTATPGTVLFADDFTGADALITNHYAYWNGWDSLRATDPNWAVESGSMFRRDSTAWTGAPDNVYSHDRNSSNGTGSQIFRAWSKRSDFASVSVEVDLKNNGFTGGSADRPAKLWDGVKIWLHHRYDNFGYALEVNRRQGNVIIQKKVAADNADGYAYHSLCNTPWDTNPNPARIGAWERVGAVARNNPDGSVTLQVLRNNGQVALQCVDSGQVGGAPLRSGDIGVRGDNTDFQFDNLTVTGA